MPETDQVTGKNPADESRQDLIARCIAGEEAAFKSLYEKFADKLYNTGYRILNNQAEAEDMVQESFLDAFRNISGFQNRSSFETWIKRILIHKCINLVNKKKLNLVELKETDEASLAADTAPDAEIEWDVKRILVAMELLPERYRIVLSLYLLEGYDQEEIAQIMKLPEATVRTQYNRGKKKLIELINRKNKS